MAPAVAQGGDGQRRGDAADQGLRRVSRPAEPVRLRVRHDHGAGVRRSEDARPSASSTPRARTSACCAPRRPRSTRASRDPCSSAAPTSSQARIAEARPAPEARRQLRRRQHPGRSALPRLLDRVLPAHAAQRRDRGAQAQEEMRSRPTLVAAMLVRRGDADAMLCGTARQLRRPPALRPQCHRLARGCDRRSAAMQMLILPGRQLFICDTHVNRDPDAEEIAEMTLLAAEEVQRFGVKPSVALLSHSSFGSSDAPSAQKMRDALDLILANARRDSRSKARCARIRRCRRRSATTSSRTRGSDRGCQPADHAERRCRATSPTTRCA